VGAGGCAGVDDDDALGRRLACAQLRDENGEEFDLGKEELALAPVVGGADGVGNVAVGGAGG
jgi:hypothetical protein